MFYLQMACYSQDFRLSKVFVEFPIVKLLKVNDPD